MSTGNVSLDILLDELKNSIDEGNDPADSIRAIKRRFSSISDKEAKDIYALVSGALDTLGKENASIVMTAPASFSLKARTTKNTVSSMLEGAEKSIMITGYSLSDYFSDMVDLIICKSQKGVFVKFYVNNIDSQDNFDKLCRYKGRFLKIYNYPRSEDTMAALHAKVLSVDGEKTLITSANLSYHGQQGNIELGTLIESKVMAKQVEDIFTQLIFKRVFVEV
ncbi:MAG: phospholipase [Lachnospiraceae bacterium]|nr:phospholipase [Lachnospiraceae bacterium]